VRRILLLDSHLRLSRLNGLYFKVLLPQFCTYSYYVMPSVLLITLQILLVECKEEEEDQ